jgi:hypothetical protein
VEIRCKLDGKGEEEKGRRGVHRYIYFARIVQFALKRGLNSQWVRQERRANETLEIGALSD